MIPNRLTFSVGFASLPQPVADVWDTIVSVLNANKCLPKEFIMGQIAGHPEDLKSERNLVLDAAGIRRVIIERALTGFDVDTGHSSRSIGFWLADIKNTGNPARLSVRIESKTKTPPTWKSLIEALFLQWPGIGAWQKNLLYRAWQNSQTTEFYESKYGPMPPGITRYIRRALDAADRDVEMINISTNPGRAKTLLPAIDFHPSAEMWLGPHFWQYARCTKEEAMAADFFLEVRDTPHFLYLKSWPEAFSRPDGEQGRQQQRIWKLFFHEDCEWPPGSGSISDEPIYGPPELMP